MRTLIVLVAVSLLLGTSASCSADQPLTQSGFRDAVARELSSKRPDLCIRSQGESGLSVGRSSEACDEVQVSTAYIYQNYVADRTHQSLYVDQLVIMALSGIVSLEAPFTPDRTRIVAVLRPDAYAANAGDAGDAESSIWRPFAGDFIAMLAQENEGQIRSLRGVDLARIGLSESQAWDLAVANLRPRLGDLERTPNAAGAEHVTSASGLAPAQLLLPDTCTPHGPDFDVFVVSRDSFFYANASKPQATAMLAGYAGELVQQDAVYSRRLLSCLDGNWYASVFNGTNAWLPER